MEAKALHSAAEREFGKAQRVEVGRVLREARCRRVLDPLVNRQDRQVARSTEATVVEHLLQVAKDRHRPVAVDQDTVYEVRPRQAQAGALDRLALVVEEEVSLVP